MAATILDAVKVATYANIGGDILDNDGVITSTYTIATKNWNIGNEPIDGIVNLTIGDRVLVKSQTNKSENGIYVFGIVTVNGDNYVRLVRSTDFATLATIEPNTVVFVKEGEKFGDTGWTVANDSNSVVGSTEIIFKRFSVNENLIGVDLPSAIVLRAEKGFPLTIDELDGNFKYLAVSLTEKFNIADFTGVNITDQINAMTAQASSLDAWELRGLSPAADHVGETQTVVIRAENGDVTSTTFHGNLKTGVADNATNAVYSQYAVDVTGIVKIAHGGTEATTEQDARDNLSVVGRAGDRMSGTLVLGGGSDNGINALAPLRIQLGVPANLSNGDIWAAELKDSVGAVIDYQLRYRYNDISKTVASLESPNFTGVTTVPDNEKTANNTRAANTKFVQLHVTDINTALALRAPLASPVLTGIPTAPTAALTIESTQIATTKYVRDKAYDILANYDTSSTVDTKINNLNNNLSPRITSAQSKADEALKNAGAPVGAVIHFPASVPPFGWLKCNGEIVSKTVYSSLFAVIGYSYGGSGDFFRLPDLRGEFLRGWDDGRGLDVGRTFSSIQSSQVQYHKHVAPYAERYNSPFGSTNNVGYQGSGRTDSDNFLYHTNDGSNFDGIVNAAGVVGNETRPRNVAMLACIKAFGVPDSYDVSVFSQAINEVNGRVRKIGDAMTGPLTLSGAPTLDLHASTKKYVDDRVTTISLTPGPQGPAGVAGVQGPQGAAGPSTYTILSGKLTVSQYLGGFLFSRASYVDIYPPAGKTMNDLVAFIPSLNNSNYNDNFDNNYNTNNACDYTLYSNFIRVTVSGSRYFWIYSYYTNPIINWLAVWRNV